MAYFNSLSSYKETQKAVAQHTTDMEESVKDAKAEASQKAYEGYSQLLDSAGGSTTGLAGGYHLTRKIYKKYKIAKGQAQDAIDSVKGKVSDAVDTAKGKVSDAVDTAKDTVKDSVGEDAEPESADFTTGDTATEGVSGVSDDPDVAFKSDNAVSNTQADSLDKLDTDQQADSNLPEPEDYELKSTNMEAPESKVSELSTGEVNDPSNVNVDNTKASDTINDLKEADQEDSATGAVKDSQFSRQELGGDNSALGGVEDAQDTFGGDIGSLQTPKTIDSSIQSSDPVLGEEPDAEKTDTNQLDGSEPADEDLPDPVDYDIKSTTNLPKTSLDASDQSAVKAGGDSTGTDLAGDLDASADRLEQGASAFKDITPTPSGGAGGLGLTGDATAGDLSEGVSSLGSSILEGVSTGLDFLGPIGEVVGAGIALGGFFHSLFDGGEKKKEDADESTQTDMSAGGGISATSLKSASNTTNLVGTTY